MQIEFISAWKQERKQGQQIFPHFHNYHELVYYSDLAGTTRIRDSIFSFFPQSYTLVPQEYEHEETHNLAGSVYCLGFQADLPLPTGIHHDADGTKLRMIRSIIQESVEQKKGYRDMLQAKLTELLIEIHRDTSSSTLRTEPLNFEYVLNYLADNYAERIVFSDLAKQLNLSYDYFQHRFRAIVGVSPQQYLMNRRLEVSRMLLKNSTISCTEIAFRCGFSNSSQFSMLFKKAFGISPQQYRRTHEENTAEVLFPCSP